MRIIEGGKAVSILGFKDIKIDDVECFLKKIKTCAYPAVVQIVDASLVAGEPHLFFAFLNSSSFTPLPDKLVKIPLTISRTFDISSLLHLI